MNTAFRRPLALARPVLLLTITCAAVWILLPRFGPGSPWTVPYNSDHAIPLLMANDEGRGLFSAYYFGQDRLGGWPMGVQRWIHNATGYFWTPESAHTLNLFWLTLGLLAAMGIHRVAGPVLAAGFLFAVTFHPVLRAQINDIGQPYVQQAAGLCWSWWALRRGIESASVRGRRGWAAAFLLFSCLTIWSSTASAPLLVVMLGVEALRLSGSARSRLRSAGPFIATLVGSVLFEVVLRKLYNRTAQREFGQSYKTSLRLDGAHLLENLQQMGAVWWNATSWLTAAGVAAALVGGSWLLWKRSTKLEDASRELTLIAFILALGGLGNLVLTMLVNHVRLNLYSDRYLTVTHLWLIAAAICMGVAIAIQLVKRPLWVSSVGAASALAAAFVVAPTGERSTRLEELRAVVAELVREPGAHVLVGDYWRTYALAALAPKGRLVPVAEDGDYVRAPFNLPAMREAQSVLVVHEPGEVAEALKKLRGEHGKLFALGTARVLERGEHVFSRYLPVAAERVAIKSVDLCASGDALKIPLADERPARVLLELESGAPALDASGPVAAVSQEGLFVTMELSSKFESAALEILPGPRAQVVLEAPENAAPEPNTVVPAGTPAAPELPTAVSPCRVKAAWLVPAAG